MENTMKIRSSFTAFGKDIISLEVAFPVELWKMTGFQYGDLIKCEMDGDMLQK